MEDSEVQLIAEQLARLRDNIESRFKRVETQILHNQELQKERNEFMRSSLDLLNEHDRDFEERIRELSKAVTTHKTSLSISQALQAGLTLVAAAIAAWLGSR